MDPIVSEISEGYASKTYEKLKELIHDCELEKEEDEAIFVYVLLNDGSRLIVTYLGYYDPDLLIVGCVDEDGYEQKALVHKSSIQILVTSEKVESIDKPNKIQYQTGYHQ